MSGPANRGRAGSAESGHPRSPVGKPAEAAAGAVATGVAEEPAGEGVAEEPAGGPDVWLKSVRICGDEFPDRTAYPFNVPAFGYNQDLRFNQSVAFLVGENGSGKSTLLEAIARRCGFHIWAQPKRSSVAGAAPAASRRAAARFGEAVAGAEAVAEAEAFDRAAAVDRAEAAAAGTASGFPATALKEYVEVKLARTSITGGVFSAESFREWAEFIDDVTEVDPGQARFHGGEKLTLRSRGEGLLAYFRGRYQIPGLYFLDEPEAALSPASQLELLRLLTGYRKRGHAQFIIATHSPIVMAVKGAQVFLLDGQSIAEITYEETAHYRLYRDFMADPSGFATD
jgi:predicted ATPase